MDYDTFMGEVQNRAQLSSREEALRVTRITLETLSERIDPGGAGNLAAQLPDEIGRHLEKVDTADSFTWDEFVDRIVERGGYDPDDEAADAVHHARVVIDVVGDAVDAGSLDDLRTEIPEDDDWDELFVLADQEEKSVDEDQRSQ